MKFIERGKFLINAVYVIFIALIIYLSYKYLFQFLLPFIIALSIGYVVQKPSHRLYEKFKIKTRIIAPILALILYLMFGAVVLLAGYYIFSNMQSAVKVISEAITGAADTLTQLFSRYSDFSEKLPEEIRLMIGNLPKGLADNAVGFLTDTLSNVASFMAKNVPSFFFSFLITVMASIYFARDFLAVKNFIFSVIPENYHKNIQKIKNIMLSDIFKMIKGYAILILITFAELCAGLLILKVKNAVLISALISLIDALPVLGVGIIIIPWAIISIITGKIGFGIFLVILYLVITVVRNILEPKILSSKLGIPPLLSLLIIFCGLKLFGFFGMIISFISLVIFIDYYRVSDQ